MKSIRSIKFSKLTDWQQPVFDRLSSFYRIDGKRHALYLPKSPEIVVKSARQRGKSYLIQVLVTYVALYKSNSDSYIIEPTNSQCRRVFKNLKKAYENAGLVKSANASTQEIELYNGSTIFLRSGEAPDTIRGGTVTGILVFDEAAFLTDECIEVCLPMVNVHRAPVLMFSTPLFADGRFYKDYIKADPKKQVWSFDWTDPSYDYSMFISAEQIEEYRASYTPMRFKTEIEGEFIKDHSFVFGDFKTCIKSPDFFDVAYMGIDWGTGTGSDSTVVTCLNSKHQVTNIFSTNSMEPSAQVDWIANLINKFHPLKVRVESNSIGEVYASLLKKKVQDKSILIDLFNTTNESKRKIIESLILAFQSKAISIINDPLLLKQLSAFEMKKLKTGYTYGNFNDSIHDDYVMSLAFAWSIATESTSRGASLGFGS